MAKSLINWRNWKGFLKMENKIRVLSLFDGIAGARQAFKNLNIDCKYYACEIDRFAIKVALKNHWDIEYFGYWKENGFDVKDLLCEEWKNSPEEIQAIGGYLKQKQLLLENKIDLLIGGSPCQDLSIAKRNGKGLDGDRSSLFFEYLRLLNKIKPKFFVLENVASMKKVDKDKITECLFGIEPIKIDSALLTAQQRKRLYWVGALQTDASYKKVEIGQPEDKGILLKDIIESGDTEKLKSYCITATYSRACPEDYFNHGQRQLIFKDPIIFSIYNNTINKSGKSYSLGTNPQCLTATAGQIIIAKEMMRKLTPIECERLQGFPDNYADCVSNTQRYKALGNSFTVPVIEHIIKALNLN